MSGRTFLFLCLLGLLSVPVTVLAIVFWRGVWRWLAVVPLVALAAYIVKIGFDVSIDKTSHNLLPLELSFWNSLTAPYLLIVFLLRLTIRTRARLRVAEGSR